MNEFVHVTFPTRRSVLVDGTPDGFTNETFVVQRGVHVFELAPPANFAPASLERTVADTTRPEPLRISFTPKRGIRAAKKAAKKRAAQKGAAKKRAAKKRATRKRAAKKRGAKKARPR